MTKPADSVDLTALDMALLPMFFISYSIVAIVQIANLFGGRHVLFAAITAGLLAIALSFRLADFSRFCAQSASAVVCGGDGEGLTAFALAWAYVSLGMLAMYLFVCGIGWLVRGEDEL